MNNTFYFLRHAKTKVDKNKPISQWVLSEIGESQAKQLTLDGVFKDIDLIFSSTEDKAYKTALPIAGSINKPVVKLSEIIELNRDDGGFKDSDEYEKTVKLCLKNPDKSFSNWETARHALQRFSKKISELDKEYDDKKILVVGHGFTINMYFAKLLNVFDNVYERLSLNNYDDWGIIKNKKVLKDIAQ